MHCVKKVRGTSRTWNAHCSRCYAVGVTILLLAWPAGALGLIAQDTVGSTTAHDFARDLNEQWGDIVAVCF